MKNANISELSFAELLYQQDVLTLEHQEWCEEVYSEGTYESMKRDEAWKKLQQVEAEIEKQILEEKNDEEI